MDGQLPTSGHTELSHDETVSLRPVQNMPLPVPPVQPLPQPAPVAAPLPVLPQPELSRPDTVAAPDPGLALTGDLVSNDPQVTWTASEFIAHPKGLVWYLVLAAVALVLTVAGYLLTRDVATIIVICLASLLFAYTAARQPRELPYALNGHGIIVGPKLYPYKSFKGFSVIEEGHFASIDFMPLKRFAPMLTVYYDPALENDIMAMLTAYLPYTEHKRTLIDSLMHRIRF